MENRIAANSRCDNFFLVGVLSELAGVSDVRRQYSDINAEVFGQFALLAAIAAHGGEGQASAACFAALDEMGRSSVMRFLNSLAGPTLER